MFKSKALKENFLEDDGPSPKKDSGPISRAATSVYDFLKFNLYYTVTGFLGRYIERISRSLAFAKIGWLSYDFDSVHLYDLMAFKLKRLRKCLENGHAIQEDSDMKALTEAAKLCTRLFNERYDDVFHRSHDKKWGKIRTWFERSSDAEDRGMNYFKSSRPNVASDEEKSQERKDFLECYDKGEKLRRKDIDRLAEILKDHAPSWWD